MHAEEEHVVADSTDEVGQQKGGREVEDGGGDGEGSLDEDEGEGEESGAAVGLHQGFDLGVFVEDGGAARVVEVGHAFVWFVLSGLYASLGGCHKIGCFRFCHLLNILWFMV